jgi:predicted peptidase
MQVLAAMIMAAPLLLGAFALADDVFKAAEFPVDQEEPLLYRIYQPEEFEPGRRYPLVLFLHGAGERGADNAAQLRHGVRDILKWSREMGEAAIIVAPQCPLQQRWVEVDWGRADHEMPTEPSAPMRSVLGLLARLQSDLPVDPERIYVSGISMGGFGTWDIIQRRPDIFAAAIPVCGGGDSKYAERIARIPIWAFHGDRDEVVLPQRSRSMIAALKAAGGSPRYREYPGVGHDSWTRTYSDPSVIEWLFSQRKR